VKGQNLSAMTSNLLHLDLNGFTIAQEALGVHEFNQVDKEAPSWEIGLSHLWSLFDMLQKYAEDFVEIGRSIQSIVGHISTIVAPNDKLNDKELLIINVNLAKIMAHALTLQMHVSFGLMHGTYKKYELSAPTWNEISVEMEFISRAINAELKTKMLFFILPHRELYFLGKNLLSDETLEKYPSTKWDIEEAGKCFATERFTAAVHHLMRVAEYGLVSFAEFCKVKNKDRANWNKALNEIESAIRDHKHPNYIQNMTKEDEQFYTEAAAWLRNVKTAWRNPVSHIPTVYDEPKALELFGAIKSLMHHLSMRFKEGTVVCSP
jgi:hypothetical protein